MQRLLMDGFGADRRSEGCVSDGAQPSHLAEAGPCWFMNSFWMLCAVLVLYADWTNTGRLIFCEPDVDLCLSKLISGWSFSTDRFVA
jgi:hypothetical protein